MFEEVIVPCHGRELEDEAMPALRAALFGKDLGPLGVFVEGAKAKHPAHAAAIQQDFQELRNDVLHGQIDYPGKGPLPEHWKQYIDREANYYDWRHPKWAQDAERFLVDATIRSSFTPAWDGRVHAEKRTTSGFVDLMLEVAENVPDAKPLVDKFLEGFPEWLQHANAFTGGYLTESEVQTLHKLLAERRGQLAGTLKTAAVLPSLMDVLGRAEKDGLGISWTVV